MNPGEDILIFTDIALNTVNIRTNFFLCCSKIIPEYTNISIHLGSEERIFSDVYEIQTWGDTPTYLELNISVLGFVEENQLVEIMPLEGSVEGKLSGQSFKDGEHAEEVSLFKSPVLQLKSDVCTLSLVNSDYIFLWIVRKCA